MARGPRVAERNVLKTRARAREEHVENPTAEALGAARFRLLSCPRVASGRIGLLAAALVTMTDVSGFPVMATSLSDLNGAFDTSTVSSSDVVAAVVVAVLTVVVAWLVGRATRHYLGRPDSNSLQVAGMTARAARWTVILVGASWSLSFLGAETSWFAITITLVLVLIVQIMKPALEKLGAGFALTSRPAFKIGDEIGVKDLQGTVLEITGRSTVLRLRDGRRAHLPNTDVVDETIIVYTTDQLRRTSVKLEVEARHSVTEVESVLLAALKTTDALASDPPPRVRALGFGEESVTLSVRFWHESSLGAATEAHDQAVRAMSTGLGQAGMALASGSLIVELRSADP